MYRNHLGSSPTTPYLGSTWLTICADYNSLKQNLNLLDSTGRLACWRLRLSEFFLDSVHRADIKNQPTGALFCLQTICEDDTPLKTNLPFLAIDAEKFHASILVLNANRNNIILLDAQDKKSVDTLPPLEDLTVVQALDNYCKKHH